MGLEPGSIFPAHERLMDRPRLKAGVTVEKEAMMARHASTATLKSCATFSSQRQR
jgi:hypothetical protein